MAVYGVECLLAKVASSEAAKPKHCSVLLAFWDTLMAEV
jgi:hypothetical protein